MEDFLIETDKYKNQKQKPASKKQIKFVEGLLSQYPSLIKPVNNDQIVVGAWLNQVTTAVSAAGYDDQTPENPDSEPLEADLEPNMGQFWDHSLESLDPGI